MGYLVSYAWAVYPDEESICLDKLLFRNFLKHTMNLLFHPFLPGQEFFGTHIKVMLAWEASVVINTMRTFPEICGGNGGGEWGSGKHLLVLRNLGIQNKIAIASSWANFICPISRFIPQT